MWKINDQKFDTESECFVPGTLGVHVRRQIRVTDIADQFLLMLYVGCVTDVAMFVGSGNCQAVVQ